MADGESRRKSLAVSVAIALTVVPVSAVLRETTDLAFWWRLLIAVSAGALVAYVLEAGMKRRG